jgi:hypothetical protein
VNDDDRETLLSEYAKLQEARHFGRVDDPRDVFFDIVQDAMDAVVGKHATLLEGRKDPEQVGLMAGMLYLGAELQHSNKKICQALEDLTSAVESLGEQLGDVDD